MTPRAHGRRGDAEPERGKDAQHNSLRFTQTAISHTHTLNGKGP
jgi:hypothetical protein